jgi:hypothetical protein
MRVLPLLLALLLCAPLPALAESVMTKAAAAMGREMDRQLSERFGRQEGSINGISLIVTTPVDLNNLEESNSVARQMQEELNLWFIQAGYSVQEVRRGKALLMRPSTGELLLTRNKDLILENEVRSALVMTGTYMLTSRHMVFNIRLMQTDGNEIYAMSNISLPISGELRSLISFNSSNDYLIEPSVFSRLP